jgi:hypothetical protein
LIPVARCPLAARFVAIFGGCGAIDFVASDAGGAPGPVLSPLLLKTGMEKKSD